MANTDPIRSVELSAGDTPSFHIRRLKSFCYPTPEDHPELPHRHNFHELIWISSGTGEQDIDGRVEDICPQTVYMIAKGQIHQFLRADKIDGMVVRFTEDFVPPTSQQRGANLLHQWFANTSRLTKLVISVADNGEFTHWFDLMTLEFESSGGGGRQAILGHLLQIVMIKLDRYLRLQASKGESPLKSRTFLFQDFLVELEENYHIYHDVAHYANSLGVTPRQLSQIAKRHTGMTAKQIINERLVLEAKRYLRFTSYSVKEVAFLLGFEDPSYFTKSFKRGAGIAPHDFRALRPS